MRFAIFTHVLHQPNAGEYSAYAPYVREMNLWLQQVDEVEVIAPLRINDDQTLGSSYQHSQVFFTRIPNFDLLSVKNTLMAILNIPVIFIKIFGVMRRADHLHLRCPGNIGLLASICQIFFPYKPKTAKYAGNWDPAARQPWSYKLQKWILSNTFLTRNMTVLVYGDWPDQSKNILPFFTASFTENEIEKNEKDLSPPYKFLFVGNLVPGKQAIFALHLIVALKEKHINAEIHVYGDGPLKYNLENEAGNKDYIHLHGNQSLEVLKQAYKEAHFLVLVSKSEGWPKAVAEAMFFGCIPISTPVSCVPQMLNYGSRGILISDMMKREEVKVDRGHPPASGVRAGRTERSKDVLNETVDRLIELIKNPEEMKRMSMEAQEWSQEYTLEKFEKAIIEILKTDKVSNKKSSSPFGRGGGEG